MIIESVKHYPEYVYCAREDVTRENMRLYDKKQDMIRKRCEELHPDYHNLNCRERGIIRRKVEAELF